MSLSPSADFAVVRHGANNLGSFSAAEAVRPFGLSRQQLQLLAMPGPPWPYPNQPNDVAAVGRYATYLPVVHVVWERSICFSFLLRTANRKYLTSCKIASIFYAVLCGKLKLLLRIGLEPSQVRQD